MDTSLLRRYIRNVILESATKLSPHDKGDNVTVAAGDDKLPEIEDDLVDLVKTSYGPLGGWQEIETPEGLRHKFTHFFVSDVDEDPEPDAGIYYTDWDGSRKASAVVSDGSQEGKSKLFDMMSQFFKRPGHWIEVSGAPANICIKRLGLDWVDSEDEVRALLSRIPQDDIEWHGSHPDSKISYGTGWYTRTIGSHRETKIIVGNP